MATGTDLTLFIELETQLYSCSPSPTVTKRVGVPKPLDLSNLSILKPQRMTTHSKVIGVLYTVNVCAAG